MMMVMLAASDSQFLFACFLGFIAQRLKEKIIDFSHLYTNGLYIQLVLIPR